MATAKQIKERLRHALVTSILSSTYASAKKKSQRSATAKATKKKGARPRVGKTRPIVSFFSPTSFSKKSANRVIKKKAAARKKLAKKR